MEKTMKSIAINYGLYLGLALSLFTLVAYAVSLSILVNYWIMLLVLPLTIIIYGIFATAKIKSAFKGYLTFKEAFSAYFITVAIGVIISTICSVLLFNFIDPNAALEIKTILISNTELFMQNRNAPVDDIAKAVNDIEQQDTFAIGTQTKSLAQSLVFFAIIGLIVAAALKKNTPNNK